MDYREEYAETLAINEVEPQDKRFVVALADYDGSLEVTIVKAPTWWMAIIVGYTKLSCLNDSELDWLDDLPDTLDAVKQYFIDAGEQIDVMEIPEE